MKRLLLLGFLLSLLACGIGDHARTSRWKNTKRHGHVMYGLTTSGQMLQSDSFPWLKKGMTEYTPLDTEALNWIKQHATHLNFEVYAATWCSDTWNLLPKFFKVLEESGIQGSSVILLDRKKHLPYRLIRPWGVRSVPMFIVKLDGSVMGRIVENLPAGVSMEMAIRNCCDKR